MILLLIFSICDRVLLGPIDLLVFISLITDMTSFLVAGFKKNEIIFIISISLDDLTIYITSNG